jgi:hypothetical protein
MNSNNSCAITVNEHGLFSLDCARVKCSSPNFRLLFHIACRLAWRPV